MGNVGAAADLSRSATTSSGDLDISWGADDQNDIASGSGAGTTPVDGDRSVRFEASLAGATSLTSEGDDVSYGLNTDGTVLTATASDGRVVFTVELSDAGSGSYDFTLLDTLDHPNADEEDDIVLTFGYVATDADGDSVSSSFTVTVDDDAPVIGEALSLIHI